VESAQEFEQFLIFNPGETGPDAHVRRDILVVGKRTFRQSAGIMALVAIHRENLAAGEGIFKTLAGWTPRPWYPQRGGTLRKVDRRMLAPEGQKAEKPHDCGDSASDSSEENGRHRRFPFPRSREKRVSCSDRPVHFQKLVANCAMKTLSCKFW
jgi:hypothetical protein